MQTLSAQWVVILLTIAILGGLDYVAGVEISFAFFYLLPVSLAAWTIGRKAGYLAAVLGALTGLAANFLSGDTYSNAFIPYWNALSRGVIFFFVALLLAELQQTQESEKQLVRTDSLTGILNQPAFYRVVSRELARIRRHHQPVTLLYLDLDNFRSINDTQGQQVGDDLLKTVARTIVEDTRAVDTVARLGGDNFAVLLPATGETGAKTIAPRLRWHLLVEMKKHHWPVTFSIGVLTCLTSPEDAEEMIQMADQSMSNVKRSSKDGISYMVYSG